MAQCDSKTLEQLITRFRHLTASEQAEKILDELGLYRQHDVRSVYERDGMSLSTKKSRPHSRWVSDWEETD